MWSSSSSTATTCARCQQAANKFADSLMLAALQLQSETHVCLSHVYLMVQPVYIGAIQRRLAGPLIEGISSMSIEGRRAALYC